MSGANGNIGKMRLICTLKTAIDAAEATETDVGSGGHLSQRQEWIPNLSCHGIHSSWTRYKS